MGQPAKGLARADARRDPRAGAPGDELAGAPAADTRVSVQSTAGNLALQYAALGLQSGTPSADWSFNPYAENASAFTNRQLVDALLFTDDWLRQHGLIELDHEAYVIRQQRLEAERQARIRRGHLWLGTVHAPQSTALFQMNEGKHGAFDVVSVDREELAYGEAGDLSGRPIMTQGQLQASLGAQGVPTVSLADYEAQSTAGLAPDLFGPDVAGYSFADARLSPTYGLAGAVALSSVRPNLLQDAFALSNPMARQGALAEVYFGTSRPAGYGFGALDYNALPWTHPVRGVEVGNFPVVDYRTMLGAMPESSVKSSSVVSADPFRRYGTYLRGLAEMLNTEPGYRGFDHYMNNAAGGRNATTVRSELSMIVNADDAADFQRFLADPFARETTPGGRPARNPNYQRAALMRVYDGVLQDRPLVIDNTTVLNSVAALDAALANGTISAAQHRAALLSAAQDASAKIRPNPELTRATLATFATARAGVPPTMSPEDVRAALTPEYMHSLSYGGGWAGDLHAMKSYGGKGALFGALFGVGREGYSMLTDDRANPDAFERLLWAGGREGVRGGLSSSLETLAATQASRYILREGLEASSGRALAARLGSRVVPGLVDVGFEGYDIATENRAHRPAEVGYRLGRAFVIGGTSALAGISAGAWAGAAVGTAIFPGVGTIVGFVVGVLIGALVGFIMNELIPNYEQMVMEQVPLKEFEKNIEAQTPASIQHQVLADQELQLLKQVAAGPEMRGPYDMREMYMRRNLSTSPGFRMYAEDLMTGSIHGGCQDCHTRKGINDFDAQFSALNEARLAPVDRMVLAALAESGNRAPRPKFLDWDMPGETVPTAIARSMAGDPTALAIMRSINTIQPNFAAWREAAPKSIGVIPSRVMNSPRDAEALYGAIRSNINWRQAYFEFFFGEVGEDEYRLYRDNLKKAEEEQKKKEGASSTP